MSESEEVKQTFQVEIEVVTKHVFVIDDVNSPEEAEQMAEDLLLDGEQGAVVDRENVNIDVFPIEGVN
jgi:hypothetical protein